LLEHFVIPEPKYFYSMAFQIRRSFPIGFHLLQMATAIDFDYEGRLRAIEIHDIRSYCPLAPKFNASQSAVTEMTPE